MGRFNAFLVALANVLLLPAILLFARGFFPYKPSIPGLAQYEPLGWEEKIGPSREPEAQFDRLVFMVVDALRSDFVFGQDSGMKFVQSLIRDGTAVPFTAHASSPTITQPRVKAMTTGSVPSFLDLILNFFESDTTGSLADQDTWLAQMNAMDGGKLVMYGDDTWLKLFPNFFARHDGTTSFFVSDFVEVDNNVTRNVPGELRNSDWDGLILHYLGLDHIGHKTGPRGPHMIPKQAEMDGIVKQIYKAIGSHGHLSNTLFVLCGDHGMNDAGGHGASSPGETSPALIFISPKMKRITESMGGKSPVEPTGEFEYHKKVKQSDLVPTLAGLLGFPIPKNNLGVFIKEFLSFWEDDTDRTRLLLQNAKQIKKIVEKTYPKAYFGDEVKQNMRCKNPADTGDELACKWQAVVQLMSSAGTTLSRSEVAALYDFLREAQGVMSNAASDYNVPLLWLGTATALTSSLLALVSLKPRSFSSNGVFFAFALVLYCIAMFGSSYVEEEHNFWYLLTGGWLVYLYVNEVRFGNLDFRRVRPRIQTRWMTPVYPVFALAVHRITIRWNQTGQKYAGADDIAKWFAQRDATREVLCWLLCTLFLVLYLLLIVSSWDFSKKSSWLIRTWHFSTVSGIIGLAMGFKIAFTAEDAPELLSPGSERIIKVFLRGTLVAQAQRVFAVLALLALALSVTVAARGRREFGRKALWALLVLLVVFFVLQAKTVNGPLFLGFLGQAWAMSKLTPHLDPIATTITTLLLAHTSYFAMGNNNAISSVDLSNAYNGVSGYNAPLVGFLVFVSNWGAPIYWSLVGVQQLLALPAADKEEDAVPDRTSENYNADDDEQHPTTPTKKQGKKARAKQFKQQKSHELAEPSSPLLPDISISPVRCPSPASKKAGSGSPSPSPSPWIRHVGLLTLWVSVATTAVMFACAHLRTHLFVWSVFSPKFLMQVAWVLAWHLGVNGVVGGVWWWVGCASR